MVGVVMGSKTDWETMSAAVNVLKEFGIPHEVKVVSAHRTPVGMVDYAQSARSRGIQLIIAGAGGAAHLPGMIASLTTLPVIGVPVESKALRGMDSLLSIVQMPKGIPVATVSIGGAANAGILAARILGLNDPSIGQKLEDFAKSQVKAVTQMNAELGFQP
jgi:5-(carboxyamino)imidazole ribonucleotide mutase